MSRHGADISRLTPRRWGLTMAETAVSCVLIGVLMVAALNMVSGSRHRQALSTDHARGQLLAQELTQEILQQNYKEPYETPVVFGPEASEKGGTRAAFDDIDDYANYQESPPGKKDGTLINGFVGWSRNVAVAWVTPGDLRTTSVTDQGIKRIIVTVKHNNAVVGQLQTVTTDCRQMPPYQ